MEDVRFSKETLGLSFKTIQGTVRSALDAILISKGNIDLSLNSLMLEGKCGYEFEQARTSKKPLYLTVNTLNFPRASFIMV